MIRHGQPEPWKVVTKRIGWSKPSRAQKLADKNYKKNDGCPPDTTVELLKPPPSLKNKRHDSEPKDKSPPIYPSFPWKANSCWLDSSLHLLYIALLDNFEEFSMLCEHLPIDSGIRYIHDFFQRLEDIKKAGKMTTVILRQERDEFRRMLKKNKLIANLSSFSSTWVCIDYINLIRF